MNAAKFYDLVKQMREAQRLYFRLDRNDPSRRDVLSESKELERHVDAELSAFFGSQKRLFDDG